MPFQSLSFTNNPVNSRKISGCFIIGTDTDVGKTIVAAALYRALLTTTSKKTALIKAVQTGVSGEHDEAADLHVYRKVIKDLESHGTTIETTLAMLERFESPCSPHLAAKLEDRSIHLPTLVDKITAFVQQGYFTIIEGAGGLLVPLNDEQTTLDLVRTLRLPVLLVFDNRVGAINHTLLTLRTLQREGIEVLGIISNRTKPNLPAERKIHADNIATITRFSGVPVLADFPHLKETDSLESWNLAAKSLHPVLEVIFQKNESQPDDVAELLRWDREHLWHPYTSATDPHPVVPITRAQGAVLVTETGCELIDGMASWWCAIHGYAKPELDTAIVRQIGQMSHVMFGGITHRLAVQLGQRILAMVPEGLDRIFYADSGSVSVEVALKMALQYRCARGENERGRFMTFRGGYHGDTTGAMSVCDPINGMHTLFSGVLSEQIFLDRPRVPFHGDADGREFQEDRRSLEDAFERHAGRTTAFILEPIVQGAGGMWFYHPEYLRVVRKLCDQYDVLLIADEIATGFGRTGKLFAVQWAGILPDILCIGKALSGGYMTLAATLATEQVARGISAGGHVFMHGPTFMANPLACAVAGASLDLLASGTWRDDVQRIEMGLREGLEPCRGLSGVADVRVLGAIGVVEMEASVDTRTLQQFFVERGVWIRPFSKLLYLMPPYCIDREQLNRLTDSVVQAVHFINRAY